MDPLPPASNSDHHESDPGDSSIWSRYCFGGEWGEGRGGTRRAPSLRAVATPCLWNRNGGTRNVAGINTPLDGAGGASCPIPCRDEGIVRSVAAVELDKGSRLAGWTLDRAGWTVLAGPAACARDRRRAMDDGRRGGVGSGTDEWTERGWADEMHCTLTGLAPSHCGRVRLVWCLTTYYDRHSRQLIVFPGWVLCKYSTGTSSTSKDAADAEKEEDDDDDDRG